MKQRCKALQSLRKDLKGTKSPKFYPGNDIWKNSSLLEWAEKDESSILVIQSSFRTLKYLEATAIELIEYLETQDQEVTWILNAFATESAQQNLQTWNSGSALKQIDIQILKKSDSLNTLTKIAHIVQNFKQDSIKTDCFDSLVFALKGMSILYVIVDMEVFEASSANSFSWPLAFGKLFAKLKVKLPLVKLKVVLLNCHLFLNNLTSYFVIKIKPLTIATADLRNSIRQY